MTPLTQIIYIVITFLWIGLVSYLLYRIECLKQTRDRYKAFLEESKPRTLPRPSITFSSETHMRVETPMVPVGPCFHANYPYCWGVESQTVYTQEQLEELRNNWMMIFDELVGDDIQHFLTTKKDK